MLNKTEHDHKSPADGRLSVLRLSRVNFKNRWINKALSNQLPKHVVTINRFHILTATESFTNNG